MPSASAVTAPTAGDTKQNESARLDAQRGSGTPISSAVAVARALTGRRTPSSLAVAADPLPPPDTTPTTLAVDGTDNVVTFQATSTAAFVLFRLDGANISAVPVTDGTASLPVETWGYPNGTHAVDAADCATADPATCNLTTPAATTFDLANAGPIVTAPADGAVITGGFTVTATAAGGGLAFLVDGIRRGFDGTAPYTFTYSGSALSTGRHTIAARQCSTDGTRCAGLQDSVTITSDSLHPKITSVSPSTFSPNGDRVKDTSTVTFTLPDTEAVKVSVTTMYGTVIRGPGSFGTLGRGTHTWTWNGRNRDNKIVGSGTYRIVLDTSATVHGAVVKGQVAHAVVVDNRVPVLAGLSAATSIYPYHDGYRDTLPVKFRLNERAGVTLTIRNSANRVVRTLRRTYNPATVTVSWNGRDAHNRVVKAGRYKWSLTAADGVGNVRRVGLHWFTLSFKRLVTKSATITRNGDSFYAAGASDPSCAEASRGESDYAHGVWLLNACFTGEIAAAFYHVTLPGAVRYNHLTVQVYGNAFYAPTSIETAFGVAGGSSNFGIGGLYEIRSAAEGWYTIGSISAARYVSSRHLANIAVTVDDSDAPCDFDIKQMRVKVTYQVLG